MSKTNDPAGSAPISDQAAVVADPSEPPGIRARRRAGEPVGGMERVGTEDVLDVHQQQLLVLLLVMQSELDQTEDLGGKRPTEQIFDGVVDGVAIGGHLAHPRPAQQPALGLGDGGARPPRSTSSTGRGSGRRPAGSPGW